MSAFWVESDCTAGTLRNISSIGSPAINIQSSKVGVKMKVTKSSWRVWGVIGVGVMLFASLACNTSAEKSTASATATPKPVAAAPMSEEQSAEAAMERITAAESLTLAKEGKAVVIDVRGTEAYKATHAKGAIDFPLSKLESGDFTGLPRDKKIIAYCT